jgi:hypothetical protein
MDRSIHRRESVVRESLYAYHSESAVLLLSIWTLCSSLLEFV